MPDLIPKLMVRPVETAEEVEILRRIRNTCRSWMTRDQRVISSKRQQEWWAKRPPLLQAFLYAVDEVTVGFGLLRYDQGKWWATLGVMPGWRGRGIGTQIYRHLIACAPEPVWIEVRSDNIPSLKAALRAGFVMRDDSDDAPPVWLLVAGKE